MPGLLFELHSCTLLVCECRPKSIFSHSDLSSSAVSTSELTISPASLWQHFLSLHSPHFCACLDGLFPSPRFLLYHFSTCVCICSKAYTLTLTTNFQIWAFCQIPSFEVEFLSCHVEFLLELEDFDGMSKIFTFLLYAFDFLFFRCYTCGYSEQFYKLLCGLDFLET